MAYFSEAREMVACPSCGYLRKVKIVRSPDGTVSRGGKRLCNMCNAERRSLLYGALSKRWYARYRALWQAREQRKRKESSR